MPFYTECPDCQTAYHLPDEQEGRRVRCKECRSVFTAEAIPTEDLENPEPAKAPKSRDEASSAAPPILKQIPIPWLIGGIVGCVGLFVIGAVVVAMILKPSAPSSARERTRTAEAVPMPVPMPAPGAPSPPPPAPVPPPVSPLSSSTPPPTAVTKAPATERSSATAPVQLSNDVPGRSSDDGTISIAARDKVKHATVYIQVTYPDGRKASGSGFFGCAEKPNLILTNAHVVGMLAPDSQKPPQNVEIVINSGEANMKKTTARVLGVDRHSDLALLDIGSTEGMPMPLNVKPASALQELETVYIFGFPFGKSFGDEITINQSRVSSLRKRNGVIEKIQVAGGMTHGNSGGPVVDPRGDVVGVAVSGVEGSLINFAIPGERVTAILRGTVTTVNVSLPYTERGKVSVPVELEMIDPFNSIRSVAVDVWTGDRGETVPAGDKQPEPRRGDSPRKRVDLSYSAGLARGDVALPEARSGKVYWIQPIYVTGGNTHWAPATAHEFRPELALHRIPATLRYRGGASSRQLSVELRNSIRAETDEEGERLAIMRSAVLAEKGASSNADGAMLRSEYRRVKYELIRGKETDPHPSLPMIEANLGRLISLVRIDSRGNCKAAALDEDKLKVGVTAVGIVTRGQRLPTPFGHGISSAEEFLETLRNFVAPIELAQAITSIPLPGEDNCTPGKAWNAPESHLLPIEMPVSPWHKKGSVVLTYTYMGQRTRPGRKPEAVIWLEGVLSGKDGGEAIGGQVTGVAAVDIGNGVPTNVDIKAVVDLEIQDKTGKSARTIATQTLHMDRDF